MTVLDLDNYFTWLYCLSPIVLLAACLFLAGAIRILWNRSVFTLWRWPGSEPAQSKKDLERWGTLKSSDWTDVAAASLFYGVIGLALLAWYADLLREVLTSSYSQEKLLGMIPGAAIALAVFGYLQITGRRRKH